MEEDREQVVSSPTEVRSAEERMLGTELGAGDGRAPGTRRRYQADCARARLSLARAVRRTTRPATGPIARLRFVQPNGFTPIDPPGWVIYEPLPSARCQSN
jgi:hypothetical protein